MLDLLLAALTLSPVDAALNAPTMRGAHVGILAIDAGAGTTIYSRNADDDFTPASTFKLLAGATALARLGPSFTFETTVVTNDPVSQGTLQGDLYLRGGGDAQLSSKDLDAAAAAVSAAGISHVAGSLIGDATRYDAPRYPGGWDIDDLPYDYAAVPSALSFELNAAHVQVLPASAAGVPATLQIHPQSTAFKIENATTTGTRGSDDSTDVTRPWDQPTVVRITGSYPLGAALSDDLAPAVPDPPAYALDAFAQALARHGVTVDGPLRFAPSPDGARTLWSHRSKPLSEILADFWLPSNNLIGEQLLLELGLSYDCGREVCFNRHLDDRDRGIAVEQSWLRSIGIDPAALTIADGSGLSEYDRATPRALTAILEYEWKGPQREAVLAALPLAGVRGTLQHTFAQPPLAGAVFAKTGSTNHSRLLAGFVRTHRGRFIVFALMINNWMDASTDAMKALDDVRAKILQWLISSY
ncbi:MAG TPA: D-alanyl-D-alanine carboxypeptidase/D-alanyl-D-alanine-endopeptidase [Candidatus Cybelea sp.]|nr:D-alanyl-D-alanine carboxypeptidase/D-alanyl-D-alanine-endopeptidase [Candidatus Cybelea sp.]